MTPASEGLGFSLQKILGRHQGLTAINYLGMFSVTLQHNSSKRNFTAFVLIRLQPQKMYTVPVHVIYHSELLLREVITIEAYIESVKDFFL